MKRLAVTQPDGHGLDAALRQARQRAVIGIGNGAELVIDTGNDATQKIDLEQIAGIVITLPLSQSLGAFHL